MRKYVSVEVEHTRYARFLSLDEAGAHQISLTTLADYQKRADVKIYLINGDQRTLLHVFQVDPLPKRHAGEPRLVLKGKFDGKKNLRLQISVDGRPFSSVSLSVKKYLRNRRVWPWVLLAALLVLGGATWFFLRSCSTADVTTSTESASQAETHTQRSRDPSQIEEQEQEIGQAKSDSQTASSSTPKSGPAESSDTEVDSDIQQSPEETPTAAGEDVSSKKPEKSLEESSEKSSQKEVAPPPNLSQKIYFGPNSSHLTEEAKNKLTRFIEELKNALGGEAESGAFQLRVAGHCALYGTEQGREELSFDRARRVAEYLENLGWKGEEKPVIRGLGGREPVTRDNEKQHLNRRVEVTLTHRDSNTNSHRDQ